MIKSKGLMGSMFEKGIWKEVVQFGETLTTLEAGAGLGLKLKSIGLMLLLLLLLLLLLTTLDRDKKGDGTEMTDVEEWIDPEDKPGLLEKGVPKLLIH